MGDLAQIYCNRTVEDYDKAIKLYELRIELLKKNNFEEDIIKYDESQIQKIYSNNIEYFINKMRKIEKENEDLHKYIIHLETLPLGEEYQKAQEDYYKLQKDSE